MKKIPLSFYYHWEGVPDTLLPSLLDEFRYNGVTDMVFSHIWATRILNEPGFFPILRRHLHRTGLRLRDIHAPWGQSFDLNCPDRARRPGLIADQKRAMAYAAECGCKSYVVHVGAYDWVFFRTPMEELRKLARETLEELLPEAEKLDLVLAVENSYEPPNAPAEVAALIESFDSPHIGCCLDVGHAHLMAPFPGKERSRYFSEIDDAWDEVVECPDALKILAPHIVTCHLHDNDGYGDYHQLPGEGTIDWPELLKQLLALPRLDSLQTESAPAGASVGRICAAFRSLPGLEA